MDSNYDKEMNTRKRRKPLIYIYLLGISSARLCQHDRQQRKVTGPKLLQNRTNRQVQLIKTD